MVVSPERYRSSGHDIAMAIGNTSSGGAEQRRHGSPGWIMAVSLQRIRARPLSLRAATSVFQTNIDSLPPRTHLLTAVDTGAAAAPARQHSDLLCDLRGALGLEYGWCNAIACTPIPAMWAKR
jgi:hypothetical protein